MQIVITGGGTGGHAFPGMQIAKEIASSDTKTKITYVGNKDSIEERLARKNTINFIAINVKPFLGKSIAKKFVSLIALFMSTLFMCGKFLKNRPQKIIGVGGYVSLAPIIAGFFLKIPIYVCEQNVVPGLANKLAGQMAKKIFIHFGSSATYFPNNKTVLVGNPIRKDFYSNEQIVFDSLKILVTGGSLGASSINKAVPLALSKLSNEQKDKLTIIHQSGKNNVSQVEKDYAKAGINAEVFEFIDDMPSAYKKSNLIICRAGATTIAEIAAFGMPAILIPYPFANDHQFYNANELAKNNQAFLLKDDSDLPNKLAELINKIEQDKDVLANIAKNVQKFFIADAEKKIVANI